MSSTELSLPTIDEVYDAQKHLKEYLVYTPLVKLNSTDQSDIEIYLKCEQFQPISSFKIRPAINAVKNLSNELKQNGIVTASAGNMAQGLSWIARKEKLLCQVLVPDTANQVKLDSIERLGGQTTKCTFEQWWNVIISHQCAMLNGHFIHPVCDRNIIAGNGTIALEILEQLPDCDVILGRFRVSFFLELIFNTSNF